MKVEVVAVHPEVTMVRVGSRQFEVPTSGFLSHPEPGQTWDLSLNRLLDERAKAEQLNKYLE